MGTSILNTSLMGLSIAQANVSTTANNIANVNTAGYHRESNTIVTTGSQSAGYGYIGTGAAVTDVTRAYNGFLETQVTQNQGQLSSYQAYTQYATQLNALLGSQNSGLAAAMSDFFSSIQNVSSDPTSTVARQAMLGSGANLATQFNNLNDGLNSLSQGINQQVQSTATQINSFAQNIATLNKQIAVMQSSGNSASVNGLMDQRDAIVSQLNQLVNVTVTDQQGSGYNVAIGNGMPLVNGTQANTMTVASNPLAPTETMPALKIGNSTITLDSTQITGGQLGGLLSFRDQMLSPSQTQLGTLAYGLTANINAQQTKGFDLSGTQGGNFFSPLSVTMPPTKALTGTATITAGLTDPNKMTSAAYTLGYDGTTYTLTDSSGKVVDSTTQPAANWSTSSPPFGAGAGLSLSASGTIVSGDSYLIPASPLKVSNLSVAITDPSKIAAASTSTALNDNANILAMAGLQSQSLLGNSTVTLQNAFTQLVGQNASLENGATSNQKIFQSLTDQATQAQQSFSGVNLDEEAAHLIQYQQAYQAAAKAMQTASTLFNSILTAMP